MKNSATAEVEIDEIEIRSKKSLNPIPNNIRKKSKIKKMIKENIVCLTISNFMFSFLLSLIIDLYNLNPLTAKANVAGIKIKFCSTKLNNVKSLPFPIPKIDTHTDIVYPKQNPL